MIPNPYYDPWKRKTHNGAIGWALILLAALAMLLSFSVARAAERVVQPGQSITDQVRLANPGDVVLVKPGVYRETVIVTRGAFTLKSEVKHGAKLEAGGIVLRADAVIVDGFWSSGFQGGGTGQPNTAALRIEANGCAFIDCKATGSDGTGIAVHGTGVAGQPIVWRKNSRIIACEASGNGRNGISAQFADGLVVLNGVATGNNTRKFSARDEGGGGKFYHSNNVTIEGGRWNDNAGIGCWFDWDNHDYVIRGIEARNNTWTAQDPWASPGICTEINGGAGGKGLIENCWTAGNSGGGIALWEASNVTVRGNKCDDAAGLVFRDMQTRAPFLLKDNVIEGNKFAAASLPQPPAGRNIILRNNATGVAAGAPAGWNSGPATNPTTEPTPPGTQPAPLPVPRVVEVKDLGTYRKIQLRYSDGVIEEVFVP